MLGARGRDLLRDVRGTWTRSSLAVLLVAVVCLAAAPGAFAYIYYPYAGSSKYSIGRAALDGSSINSQFIPGLGGSQLAIDAHRIYWTDSRSGVGRANINGTGARSSWIKPRGFAAFGGVSVDAHHVYWGNINFTGCSIGRASLAGTHVHKNLIVGPCVGGGVAAVGKYLYFVSTAYKKNGAQWDAIFRVPTKGGKVHLLVWVRSIAGFAVAKNHIYWDTDNAIGRSDLKGRHAGLLVHNIAPTYPDSACGVAVGAGHIYWGAVVSDAINGSHGVIGRANLDGSGKTPVFINGFGENPPCVGAVDLLGPGG